MAAPVSDRAERVLEVCNPHLERSNRRIIQVKCGVADNNVQSVVACEFPTSSCADDIIRQLFILTPDELTAQGYRPANTLTRIPRNAVAVLESRVGNLTRNHVSVLVDNEDAAESLQEPEILSEDLLGDLSKIPIAMSRHNLLPSALLTPAEWPVGTHTLVQKYSAELTARSVGQSGAEGAIRRYNIEALLTFYWKRTLQIEWRSKYPESDLRYDLDDIFFPVMSKIQKIVSAALEVVERNTPGLESRPDGNGLREHYFRSCMVVDALYFMCKPGCKYENRSFAYFYAIRDMVQKFTDHTNAKGGVLRIDFKDRVYSYQLMEQAVSALKDIRYLSTYNLSNSDETARFQRIAFRKSSIFMWILCHVFDRVLNSGETSGMVTPQAWHVHKFIHSVYETAGDIFASPLMTHVVPNDERRRELSDIFFNKIKDRVTRPTFMFWRDVLSTGEEGTLDTEMNGWLRKITVNKGNQPGNVHDLDQDALLEYTAFHEVLVALQKDRFLRDEKIALISVLVDIRFNGAQSSGSVQRNVLYWNKFAEAFGLPKLGTFMPETEESRKGIASASNPFCSKDVPIVRDTLVTPQEYDVPDFGLEYDDPTPQSPAPVPQPTPAASQTPQPASRPTTTTTTQQPAPVARPTTTTTTQQPVSASQTQQSVLRPTTTQQPASVARLTTTQQPAPVPRPTTTTTTQQPAPVPRPTTTTTTQQSVPRTMIAQASAFPHEAANNLGRPFSDPEPILLGDRARRPLSIGGRPLRKRVKDMFPMESGWSLTLKHGPVPQEQELLRKEYERRKSAWEILVERGPRYSRPQSTSRKKPKEYYIYAWSRLERFSPKEVLASAAQNFSFWSEPVLCNHNINNFVLSQVITSDVMIRRFIIDHAKDYKFGVGLRPYENRAGTADINDLYKTMLEDQIVQRLNAPMKASAEFDDKTFRNKYNPYEYVGLLMAMLIAESEQTVLVELARFMICQEVTSNFHLLNICRHALRSVFNANLVLMILEMKTDDGTELPVAFSGQRNTIYFSMLQEIDHVVFKSTKELSWEHKPDFASGMGTGDTEDLIRRFTEYRNVIQDAMCNEVIHTCRAYLPGIASELAARLKYAYVVDKLGDVEIPISSNMDLAEFIAPANTEHEKEALYYEDADADGLPDEPCVLEAPKLQDIPPYMDVENANLPPVKLSDLAEIAIMNKDGYANYANHCFSLGPGAFENIPVDILEKVLGATIEKTQKYKEWKNNIVIHDGDDADRRKLCAEVASNLYMQHNVVENTFLTLLRARIVAKKTADSTCALDEFCDLLIQNKTKSRVITNRLLDAIHWEAQWMLFRNRKSKYAEYHHSFWIELSRVLSASGLDVRKFFTLDQKAFTDPRDIVHVFNSAVPRITEARKDINRAFLKEAQLKPLPVSYRDGEDMDLPLDAMGEAHAAAIDFAIGGDDDPMMLDSLLDDLLSIDQDADVSAGGGFVNLTRAVSEADLRGYTPHQSAYFIAQYGRVSDMIYAIPLLARWVIDMPDPVFAHMGNILRGSYKLEMTWYFRMSAAKLIYEGIGKELAKLSPSDIELMPKVKTAVSALAGLYKTGQWPKDGSQVTYASVSRLQATSVSNVYYEPRYGMVDASGVLGLLEYLNLDAELRQTLERIDKIDIKPDQFAYLYYLVHMAAKNTENEALSELLKVVVTFAKNCVRKRINVVKLRRRNIVARIFYNEVTERKLRVEQWQEPAWRFELDGIHNYLLSFQVNTQLESELIAKLQKDIKIVKRNVDLTDAFEKIETTNAFNKRTNVDKKRAVGYYYTTLSVLDVRRRFNDLLVLEADPNRRAVSNEETAAAVVREDKRQRLHREGTGSHMGTPNTAFQTLRDAAALANQEHQGTPVDPDNQTQDWIEQGASQMGNGTPGDERPPQNDPLVQTPGGRLEEALQESNPQQGPPNYLAQVPVPGAPQTPSTSAQLGGEGVEQLTTDPFSEAFNNGEFKLPGGGNGGY